MRKMRQYVYRRYDVLCVRECIACLISRRACAYVEASTECAASKRRRASSMAARLRRAHRPRPLTGSSSERPSFVSAYSTRGGMVGKTVRVTRPSRSSARSVSVSMRCEMLPSARRISLKRFGPLPSSVTTSTVHLSPTRARTSLTARQSSGKFRFLGITGVPSCALATVNYLAQVTKEYQVAAAKASPTPEFVYDVTYELSGDAHVHSTRETHRSIDAHHGRRGREAPARVRLRRHRRVRSVPPARRFPQREPGRLSCRLPLAPAPRHRDHHVCARRDGRSWRQPRQPRQARRRRRAMDDGGKRNPPPGDAAGRCARPHARVPAVGQ